MNVYYAEIDESGSRTVTQTTRGTALHLMEPRPVAWGYFESERAARTGRLPGVDWTRYNKLVESRGYFFVLDRVASQLADETQEVTH